MVSRDDLASAGVLAVVLVAGAALEWYRPHLDGLTYGALGLLLLGLVYAGSHLVLAVLGVDGVVPVGSRWRFVGLVSFLLALRAAWHLTAPVSLGVVSSDDLLAALAVTAVVAYWAVEARSGYRDWRTSDST